MREEVSFREGQKQSQLQNFEECNFQRIVHSEMCHITCGYQIIFTIVNRGYGLTFLK